MKIAFVDHYYHQNTKSTRFFAEDVLRGHDLTYFWDESWNGKPLEPLVQSVLDGAFDLIVVFQSEHAARLLAIASRHGRGPSVVFIPMWDGCQNLGPEYWQDLADVRIVSFCRRLHERVTRLGLFSLHVQFFPDPAGFQQVDYTEASAFLWWRVAGIGWPEARTILGGWRPGRFHLHLAHDPDVDRAALVMPTPSEIEAHGITTSTWFADAAAFRKVLSASNIVIAPRPSEGIGMLMLEAMAAGSCVVANDAPTMNEYIVPQVNGVLADFTRPRPLDLRRFREMGLRARETVVAGHAAWVAGMDRLRDFVCAPPATLKRADFNALHLRRAGAVAAPVPAATPQPKVTVVTVVRNDPVGLAMTMDNVTGQDYPNLEYLVLDGASTDGTVEVIRRHATPLTRWTSEPDLGPFDAMNRAATLATGDYVIFMNAGDWFAGADAISRAMRTVPADADFVIGHHIFRVDDRDEQLHRAADFGVTWDALRHGPVDAAWLEGIPGHQATFTRTALLRAHRYDCRYRIAADHDFMYRMKAAGARFFHCLETVSVYVSGGLSHRNQLRLFDEWAEIAARHGGADAIAFFESLREAARPKPVAVAPPPPSRNEALEAEIAALRAENAELHGQIAAIRRSASWMMTYPMRWVMRRSSLLRAAWSRVPLPGRNRALNQGPQTPPNPAPPTAEGIVAQPPAAAQSPSPEHQMNTAPADAATDLERIIPPEIKDDAFYRLIRDLAATESLRHVLEIGSSAGGGSTEAFVAGLSRNHGSPKLFCIEVSKPRFEVLRQAYADRPFVQCYNMSSVAVEEFPSEAEVTAFYNTEVSGLTRYPLPEVLRWLADDIAYVRDAGVEAGAIDRIKAEHGIDHFDLVLIDGSEFTGDIELSKVLGAKIILLDDTNTYKCFKARQQLIANPDYEMFADDQALRNGYSAFRRRADATPIHFFTIVLNGEPFIRYHETMLARLPFRWHWHVVEGVAALRHDTAWATANGGRVTDDIHRDGRSNDGTSEYLDDLAARFPDNVTIYRKPPGEFWDGKKEMVNAPLPNITEPCLLWQVDADELWTVDQVVEMRRLFREQPGRGAANYWCWYFVGPDKVISTRYNYAQNPGQEWLRTWNFLPGDRWAAHEPPTLVRDRPEGGEPIDIATLNPFTHDETEAHGLVFQHFAYVTPAQLGFKESYYGYAGATARWRELLKTTQSGLLADYFPWVTDRTVFDNAAALRVEPIARLGADGAWHFAEPTGVKDRAPLPATPRIVIDGIYWQYLSSGIGRVWQSLIEDWVKDGLSDHVVLLDRAGTAPRIPGVHYHTIAKHDYGRCGADSLYLDRVCRDLGADLFVSTYYSTPTATPSFFFGHDMIPEATGLDLSDEGWQEKARAIRHAAGHLMVSRHSARDLARFCPAVAEADVIVAHNGLSPAFSAPPASEVAAAKAEHGLSRPYLLMVGDRSGAGGYKNGILAFRAAELAAQRGAVFEIVCIGGLEDIEPDYRAAAPSVPMRRLKVDDAALRLIYAGAHALLYPSRYEGFGMPVLEAMACGCPVVTCANSSLIEVGGDAAIFIDPDKPAEAMEAILALQDPATRAARIAAGLAQAATFTIADQAKVTFDAFRAVIDDLKAGRREAPGRGWAEFRTYQAGMQAWLQRRPDLAAEALAEAGMSAGPAVPAAPSGELLRALAEIEAMKKSPFWRLRAKVIGMLRGAGLRHRG